MASNPELRGVESIILDELRCRVENPRILSEVADCLLVFSKAFNGQWAIEMQNVGDQLNSGVLRLLRHRDVCAAIETDRFVRVIQGAVAARDTLIGRRHSRERLARVAQRVRDNKVIKKNLIRAFGKGRSPTSATSASLLVRTIPDWRPRGEKFSLRGAYLDEVHWPDIRLIEADLQNASLRCANLKGAQFQLAKLECTDFTESSLRSAAFGFVGSARADVSADGNDPEPRPHLSVIAKLKRIFTRRKSNRSRLHRCRFAGANLEDANLRDCEVARCDFSEADLSNADASHSSFGECQFLGTDLTRADFTAT